MQDEIHVGLLDALAGESIEDCVAETGIQGLSILPLGSAMPADVSRLSPAAIKNLLNRARERYDIVLIDTGPVPGSLEASTVASAADAVVLVVSRGEHRPMTEKSIRHLTDIGASIAGMVFNRARTQDMDFETTASRITSMNRTGRAQSMPRQADYNDPRFGPVASAVTGGSHNPKSPDKK
jgi:Mrp family chromosome partitioning ATPase